MILKGCPATTKNMEGQLPRIIAKENEHKDALKECKKAEKIKGTKPGTQLEIVKVMNVCLLHCLHDFLCNLLYRSITFLSLR